MDEEVVIETKCFICGSEIEDNQSVFVGNKNDPNIFTPESASEFSMFHSECYQTQNLSTEPELIIEDMEQE